MSAYYNEIDPKAAAWLRELIKAGAIAPGDVDEQSIVDVRPGDLRGYRQCHFFAGVGIWSYALRQAGWSDEREVWTGSCPCQPFSDAGARDGFQDSRHLWPVWFELIRECRPVVVFGEQVASKDGLAWLDAVHADLEAETYAVGAVDTCAAGFGAPHIRQRFFFVADAADAERRTGERGAEAGARPNGERRRGSSGRSADGWMADTGSNGAGQHARELHGDEEQDGTHSTNASIAGGTTRALDHAASRRNRRAAESEGRPECPPSSDGQDEGCRLLQPQHAGIARGLGDPSSGGCREFGDAPCPRGRGHAHGAEHASGGVANADGGNEGNGSIQRGGQHGLFAQDGGVGGLANPDVERRTGDSGAQPGVLERPNIAVADGGGSVRPGPLNGFWRAADWLFCTDGKWRPVEPGTFPLVDGAPARLVRLRGYGNGINAEVARAFIEAYLDVRAAA